MWAFLFAAVGPLAIRALTLIGFGAVTFTGMTALVGQLVTAAQTHWSALPVAVLQIATLAGFPTALGLIFAAFVARTTLWVGASAAKLVFKGST